jgi:hypothetical protein
MPSRFPDARPARVTAADRALRPPAIASDGASIANLAGRYSGTFSIKGKPVGDIDFNLTQSGTAIGGVLKLVVSKTYKEPVALTLEALQHPLECSELV